MRRIYVEIQEATFEAIAEEAVRQRRSPRDHAGWLLDLWARSGQVDGSLDVRGDGPIEFRVVKEDAV